ncbi:hypothetical protein H5410_053820 [Solanum commersonii]|uniref:Uncharacterized protein n=1 Tax=Solanum commersonii TaxID=4109 RepID=A0A9J5X4I1_SOLCO|nr:hypothetical protein H5410_053820 [Solanum commersonii]
MVRQLTNKPGLSCRSNFNTNHSGYWFKGTQPRRTSLHGYGALPVDASPALARIVSKSPSGWTSRVTVPRSSIVLRAAMVVDPANSYYKRASVMIPSQGRGKAAYTLPFPNFTCGTTRVKSTLNQRSSPTLPLTLLDKPSLASKCIQPNYSTLLSVELNLEVNDFDFTYIPLVNNTSKGYRLAPTLSKPVFSSSSVMCPLLSASIILNISFSPAISSPDRLSAIT